MKASYTAALSSDILFTFVIGTSFNMCCFINRYREGVYCVASKRIDNARSVGGEAGRGAAFNYLFREMLNPQFGSKSCQPFLS